jgi:hypothetical protein
MLRDGSIEEFKANVSQGGGFAKPNLYYVQLPTIAGIAPYNIGLLTQELDLPTRQLTTVERNIGIVKQQVSYGYVNQGIAMTFRVLNNHGVREYFEKWHQYVLGEYGTNEGHYGARYANEYVKPITIYQLERGVSFPFFSKQFDKKLGPFNINLDIDIDKYKWTINRAFPLSITHGALGDVETGISTLQVAFEYKDFRGQIMQTNEDKGFSFVGGADVNL